AEDGIRDLTVTGVQTCALPILPVSWYRGRFRATGKETGIHLVSDSGGGAQAFSAWLNGTFLGSSTTGSADFTFPAGSVKSTGDKIGRASCRERVWRSVGARAVK